MSFNSKIVSAVFIFLLAGITNAETITISCVRDDNTTNTHEKMNFKFIFDTTSELAEIHWEYAPGKWNNSSAQVKRTEREIILTDYSDSSRYWISRTEVAVKEADSRLSYLDCKMSKEETKEQLY